jgi:hypothetical protein
LADSDDSVDKELATKSTHAKKRFLASMEMNYEKWHDGVGYDLLAIDEMAQPDKDSVVDVLSANLSEPWRTFEALERINTPKARSIISKNLENPSLDVRIAASRFVKGADKEREQILIEALEKSEFYEGLTQALDQIETFHPQGIIDALLRGLLVHGDSAAVNFAGMLLYIYGKSDSSFDWDQRPLFLRFGTSNLDDRRKAFEELCGIIGISPKKYYQAEP